MHLLRFDADGTLDSGGFGDEGEVVMDAPGSSASVANDVAIGSFGKVLIAGTSFGTSSSTFMVARLNSNGTPDTGFSQDGFAFASPLNAEGSAQAVVSHQGKVIAAGTTRMGSQPVMTVARFNSDGSTDMTFGGDGVVEVAITGWRTFGFSVAMMPISGRIVVAGTGTNLSSGESRFLVARLNVDGTFDGTFSEDGKAMVAFPGAGQAYGYDVAVTVGLTENVGWIALGGSVFGGVSHRFGVALLTQTGQYVNTFDGDGRKTISFPGANEHQAPALDVDAQGRIVLGGWASSATGARFALARVLDTGKLDPNFSGDGLLTIDFASFEAEFASDIDVALNGNIVVAGHAHGGEPFNELLAIAHVRFDGLLIKAFSGDGKASFDAPFHAQNFASGVALEEDGQIVTAGVVDGPLE